MEAGLSISKFFSCVAFVLVSSLPAHAGPSPSDSFDKFSKHALAEWVVTGETLPASPAALAKLLSDLPAAVRLARVVTGLEYVLVPVDTGEYELTTPRGLTARLRPAVTSLSRDTGIFEAFGSGTFRRQNITFRGLYALRFIYRRSPAGASCVSDIHLYIDVENPFLRLLGLLARGLINRRVDEELQRMLLEAKDVMAAAENRLVRGVF